jgi:T5SS/PEP-CTERM-associated repeat protein
MMNRTIGCFAASLLVVCASAFGYSNPIEGGATETVTNVWNVPLPWLIVGGNSASNALIVSDGGEVNDAIGYIGNAVTSTDNSALVTGDGSVWNNTLELSVGYQGATNSLTVADGGSVTTPNAYIGNNSDGNAVIVTGINSLLDAAALNVGYQGDDNRLLVTDGGRVESDTGIIGYWISSDGNIAIVQSNGIWNSSTELNIGEYGSGNRLAVGAGGLASSPVVNVGVQSIASKNSVTVTGDGAWLDAPELYIGGSAAGAGGIGNLVEVENGGTVYTESLNIYSNNAFDLNDGGRLFVNTNFNASMDHFNFNAGGTLEVGGELTGMTNSIEDRRGLVLNGSNAVWDISASDLKVGESTAGNSLSIINSALVENQIGYIGYHSAADSNSVLVTGNGSVWQNDEGLYLGGYYVGTNWVDGGTGNSLTLEGGWVLVGDIDTNDIPDTGDFSTIVVGDSSGTAEIIVNNGSMVASDFSALGIGINDSGKSLITGYGSKWDNRRDFFVGYEGSGNTLEISDGGHVYNDYGFIGHMASSSSNSVLVTGSGSVWSNREYVVVGTSGSHSTLSIVDGGQVLDSRGVIGYIAGSDSNTVLVAGTGSVWSNRDGLAIGESGSHNMLSIIAGGHVYSEFSVIGAATNSSNNSVLVDGAGSVWSNRSGVAVGVFGDGNLMRIEEGGKVLSAHGTLGNEIGSDNNTVLVTGAGSVWSNSYDLNVGGFGSGNLLEVSDAGRVESGRGLIGELSSAVNNLVQVTGTGSVWNNTGELYVGYQGSGNELSIEDGGRVENQNGYIGYSVGADSNSVLVTGNGSVWQNYEGLYLGQRYWIEGSGGKGNSLTVEHGGRVLVGEMDADLLSGGGVAIGSISADVQISAASGSLVNTENTWIGFGSNHVAFLRVSGSNTVWSSSANLYVGYQGAGNYLSLIESSMVEVGENLYNRNASTVYLDPESQISIGGDYYQDASSMLRFGVETNAAGAPINALITVGGTAEFEEGAQIEYASNVGELLFDRFYTNKLIEADALIVAGIENPDSLDLERLDASGSLVDVIFWENDQDIYALAGRRYLADSAGFIEGSMMARLSKEIDDMSLLGNADAMDMIYMLNTMSGSAQHNELLQQYAYTTPGYLHIQGMTVGLGELAKHVSHRPAPAPEGAAGPYSADRGARGWIRPYGQWSDRSDQDGFSGYDHNVYGTLVGIDWIQDSVLLGIAGGYARSDIDQDDGSESEAVTGYGVFYASVGTKDWFGDISMAFGRSDIEDDSGTVFGADADYEANNFALYAGGGKEMRSPGGRFFFTPQASLLLSQYQQTSYTEKMSTGVAREVEAYDHNSVVSSLGAAVAMQQEYDTVTLRPEVRLRWLHEFEDDEEKLDFTLSEGMGGQFFSLMPGAEEDILEAGAGLSCGFDNAWALMLDLDWRFGEDYDAYSVSGRAVYEF